MSVHRDVAELVETTIKSPDLLWYEVHEANVDGEVRLIGIDDRTDTTISHDELRKRMADGWEEVYGGITGEQNPKVGWP